MKAVFLVFLMGQYFFTDLKFDLLIGCKAVEGSSFTFWAVGFLCSIMEHIPAKNRNALIIHRESGLMAAPAGDLTLW